MLDRRDRLPTDVQKISAEKVGKNLFRRVELINELDVGLYWSFRGEVSTQTIFLKLRREGKNLYLPRMNKVQSDLEFVLVSSEEQLIKGPFDTFQPEPNLPAVSLNKIGVMIVPGLAFDIKGHRIGWGQGYYDRILKGYPGKRVGLAYDFQVVEDIPIDKNDESVHLIITDKGEIECLWIDD